MSTRSRTGSTAPAPLRPVITKKRDNRSSSQNKASTSSRAVAAPKMLPDVTVLCDDGQPRRLLSLLTDDTPGMILFTYPKANTSGCTTQACGLSSYATDAASAGYITLGASYDSVKSQASWKAKHTLVPHLVCDTLDVGLLKKLGAHKAPKSVKRSVFIIRRGGLSSQGNDPIIVESRINISPKDSIEFVQQFVRENPSKKPAKSEEKKEAPNVDEPAVGKPEMKNDTPTKEAPGANSEVPISKDDAKASPKPSEKEDEKMVDQSTAAAEPPKSEGDKQ